MAQVTFFCFFLPCYSKTAIIIQSGLRGPGPIRLPFPPQTETSGIQHQCDLEQETRLKLVALLGYGEKWY